MCPQGASFIIFMTPEIIVQIILFGIALSMDAFAVSVIDGLIYEDINKKKSIFIAASFGIMQALMPLIGFWLIELISFIAGQSGGTEAGKILSTVVAWVSFALLLVIGFKMIIEAIFEMKKTPEEKLPQKFSYKQVLLMSVATSIDALATGVALHNQTSAGVSISTTSTIWLHVCIIMVITFSISLVGLLFGHLFEKLFKGKYEITSIIGGIILISLAIWIVVEHYVAF